MTVTLAYYDSVSDKCYIGADSCASDAINHSVCKNMKCFHPVGRRDVLIGCAGTFRLPNLLQYVPNVFPEEEDLPMKRLTWRGLLMSSHQYLVHLLMTLKMMTFGNC